MMRLRRASTIAALCVLASTATVYAECAWVLWTNLELVNSSMPSEWGIVKAVATRQDCIAAMRKMYNQVRAGTTTANDDIEGGSFLVALRAEGATWHSTLTMVKRYAHFAPEHLRAAAAVLDGVLSEPDRHSKEKAIQPIEIR